MKAIVFLVTIILADAAAKISLQSHEADDFTSPVGAVLEATSQPSCSLIIIIDGATSSSPILKAVSNEEASPRGFTLFKVTSDGQNVNTTEKLLLEQIIQARQVRLGSWCVTVMVVSHDPAFLAAFAESSLKGRLLSEVNSLLVVTRLTQQLLRYLLPAHWSYHLMKTIFLNREERFPNFRYRLYTYLPYSPEGAQVVRVASWSSRRGIVLSPGLSLFSDKFKNFYKANVDVASRPWPPFWIEEEVKAPDGSVTKKYSGSDYLALEAISKVLNFSINVLYVENWPAASRKVAERKAFFVPAYHFVLPERVKFHGFTFTYEFVLMSFSMAKPRLKPRWQSLYYPLTNEVWIATLIVLLLMPVFFYMIISVGESGTVNGKLSAGLVVLEVTGILFGQNLPLRLPNISATRLLLTVWLVFSFIIGTIYRGNLTAALTLPKFPPRPETLEELVDTVDRVTMPPIGEDWRKFFAASDSKSYKKMAELLDIGPSVKQGLQTATEYNTAQLTDRRNMANNIAQHFTEADGSTRLYIGRDPAFYGPAGWPIPHDAPFKPRVDRCLMAIIEAGLYEKWSEDILWETRLESHRRKREYLAQQQQGAKGNTDTSSRIKALTFIHMQGPLLLLILGLVNAWIIFIGEIIVRLYWMLKRKKGTNFMDGRNIFTDILRP